MCRKLKPDILLLDISMKPFNGIEATRQVRRVSRETGIIAVTLHTQPAYVKKLLQIGARGYVTKNSPSEEMIEAIQVVASGNVYICAEMRELLEGAKIKEERYHSIYLLTAREMEVIRLVREGYTSKEISEQIDVALKTVETHKFNIYRKLGVNNTAMLIEFLNASAIHI
jgi:two-component system, NarL family, invasion response regulator UvrY